MARPGPLEEEGQGEQAKPAVVPMPRQDEQAEQNNRQGRHHCAGSTDGRGSWLRHQQTTWCWNLEAQRQLRVSPRLERFLRIHAHRIGSHPSKGSFAQRNVQPTVTHDAILDTQRPLYTRPSPVTRGILQNDTNHPTSNDQSHPLLCT